MTSYPPSTELRGEGMEPKSIVCQGPNTKGGVLLSFLLYKVSGNSHHHLPLS